MCASRIVPKRASSHTSHFRPPEGRPSVSGWPLSHYRPIRLTPTLSCVAITLAPMRQPHTVTPNLDHWTGWTHTFGKRVHLSASESTRNLIHQRMQCTVTVMPVDSISKYPFSPQSTVKQGMIYLPFDLCRHTST